MLALLGYGLAVGTLFPRGRALLPGMISGQNLLVVLFFLSLALVALLPVIRGVRLGFAQAADRFGYLPLIGLGIAAAWTAGEWAERRPRQRPALGLAGGLVLAACLVRTPAQLGWWGNSAMLFQRAVFLAPGSSMAHDSLGLALRDAGRDEEGAFSGLPQRITPEGSSQVVLSSSDINRLICPVEIKDVIYSKEKGLTVRLAGNNAFVKFLVMKKDGKDLYATTPSELYMVCGENVYTMIAVPRRIPAQTVQLSGGKADSIRKNLTLFSEVPFEKRIIAIIKSIYTDRVPDSFTVRKIDKAYPVFQGLSLVLNTIVTIDGEGLTVKEYRARIAEGSKENTLTLREKDFLTTDLAQKPVAVSIDTLNLKKGEISRIFVVERTEGGQP